MLTFFSTLDVKSSQKDFERIALLQLYQAFLLERILFFFIFCHNKLFLQDFLQGFETCLLGFAPIKSKDITEVRQ